MQNLKSKISDIEVKTLSVFSRKSSQLSSLEISQEVPWPIQRVFFITCLQEEVRGEHAHKECIQAILCTVGHVEIACLDGEEEKVYSLNSIEKLLIVPPGIWIKINFQPGSSITVLASEKFAESDYIRNWEEFQKYRQAN